MKRKPNLPVLDWMRKGDLSSAVKIEDSNHGYEGWSEKRLTSELRDRNTIGLVVKIGDLVCGFAVYTWKEKEVFLHKFELTKDLDTGTAGKVLLNKIKSKALKRERNVVAVFPEERQSIPKYQFFVKEGFKSSLKRNFFPSLDCDGYEFVWNHNEDSEFVFEDDDNLT